jgi:hypothetical protein
MATIHKEVTLETDADTAWASLGDFGKAGELFAGVLVECKRVGDIRTVKFSNGAQVSEQLVTADADQRRIVYTVLGRPYSHNNASMQIVAQGKNCTFVWINDFLPEEASARVLPLMEAGCQAIQRYFARR